MCTLSWVPLPGGYALAMNRDELRTRARATPPARRDLHGVPALLPADGQAGGTWISTNALGHSLALLNRWDETPFDATGPFVSRGLLVLELAHLPGPRAVEQALAGMVLASYRPFTLTSLVTDQPPWLFEWDGRRLERGQVTAPGLVRASSGSDQAGAERERGRLFREAAARPGGLTPEILWAHHRSHRPEKGPTSICMHRDEAVTVSASLITASPKFMTFRYLDGSPCESTALTELSLERAFAEEAP
ncbi:MAG TPA: NRDE family protein [Gemmatimonadales bacterium]|nr:NRDE family protein [Gemmatimonadales bacterium]